MAYLKDDRSATEYCADKHLIVRYRLNKAGNSSLFRGCTLYTVSSLVAGDLEGVSLLTAGAFVKFVSIGIGTKSVGLLCFLKETQRPRSWSIS